MQRIVIDTKTAAIMEDDSVFMLVQEGHGSITINGKPFDLAPGSFCWLQSYHAFSIAPARGEALLIRACVYDYPLSSYMTYIDSSNIALDIYTLRPPIIDCSKGPSSRIAALMDSFELECEVDDRGSTLIRASILGEISELFISESLELLRREPPVDRPLGWDIMVYLSMFCSQSLSATEVSRVFGVSVGRLNLELRKICGLGFAKALSRARINLAASSVLFGELSFSFISSRAGFRTDAEFYRAFMEFKGMTPQQYRAMCIGNGWFRKPVDETSISVLHYLYISSRDDITMTSLSKALFLSAYTIRESLKTSFGMSFQEILNAYRLRNAEALLAVSRLSILDISLMVGFNSERTFSRLFRQANNMSPREYRKKYQGAKND